MKGKDRLGKIETRDDNRGNGGVIGRENKQSKK